MKVEQVYEHLERINSSKNGESQPKQDLKPWEKGLPPAKDIIVDCPKSITIVLANKIYIETKTLPQTLLTRLKRLASFSNPVFFKTQALRFSTNGIPRFICLANIEQGYINLPRGCFDDVVKLLEQQSIIIEVEDKRKSGQRIKSIQFKGELRKDQKKTVTMMSKHDVGILHAPTAFGKTVTAIGLIYKRKVNTLILVHTRQLVDQWKERLSSFLSGVEIGIISGGKSKPTGQVDIATYQSMINRKDNSVNQHLFDYGQVIIDECHHISAPNYDMLLSEVHARYVFGITATPQRQDGHQPIIFMQADPIRHTVKSDAREHFEQRAIVTQLDTIPPQEFLNCERSPNISNVYQWLMEDKDRNKQIIDDVVAEVVKNRHPIILTERREHAMILADLIAARKISFQVLRGAMKSKELKTAMDNINDSQVLIATGKYIGEGFDLAKLDTLFLALPISWKGLLAQYVGRIHRQFKGKERVIVYDYVDQALPMLQRMFKKRSKGYEAMGYSLSFKDDDTLIQTKLF
ncbi:MAG: DEAD/DEAH box helicase [gamma proteobacterium symbiont of Taylorina sp.]|nr:DEAD/DEAH box helicase [gamma proteobacterium symbiont of Taylorina sp.]